MKSNDKNDGGPAFPIQLNRHPDAVTFKGMSLRDWFAGMVLCGFASDPDWVPAPEQTAKHAYEWADAMIEERKKNP